MTRLALSTRSAVSIFDAGYSIAAVQQGLNEEEVVVIKRLLYCLIKKFKEKRANTNLPQRACDKKLRKC